MKLIVEHKKYPVIDMRWSKILAFKGELKS